ncbi:hypothetical protein OPT61_g8560 [Boeremia exigua]|uniref:Uncharacterized protein n=1 Tax=Boeremia exigua TaxID=749465 RepID=A0ACC2HXQ8_9PLEO|nr:hypothetical protein OPT61_g8560 [Boeremia exigua]
MDHGKDQLKGSLPKYWLGAKDILCHSLPPLFIGKAREQTVSKPGSIKIYFRGELCKWTSFEEEVLRFWRHKSMVRGLELCAHLPVGPDPNIKECNPNAMGTECTESIQCGSEITVSGRFYSNALGPVIHCIRTLSANGGDGPQDATFGDAWIRDMRVLGQLPDIIGKVQIGESLETRLVGEVKFPGTVDIAKMVKSAIDGKSTEEFRAVLGQVVNYMLGHNLKFAFLTNYKVTTCLQFSHFSTGDGIVKPRVAFSDTINFDNTMDKGQISVRLALFYLIFQVSSDKEEIWRIPEETVTMTREAGWLSKDPAPPEPLNTPMRNTYEGSGTHFSDSPGELSPLVVTQAQTDPFSRHESDIDRRYRQGTGARSRYMSFSTYEPLSTSTTPTTSPAERHSESYYELSVDGESPSARNPQRSMHPISDTVKEDPSSELETVTESIENLGVTDQNSRSAHDPSS